MRTKVAIIAILVGLWLLQSARVDVDISRTTMANTPVTTFTKTSTDGPAVVIAHGFAGSSQMMQGYALPLARAGYIVHSFDFLGHGRHLDPMSGDVTAIEGTTRLLVEQVEAVIDAVGTGDDKIALLGHSMATDILVRVAQRRSEVGPVVLLSAFSEEVDRKTPEDALFIVGAWEPGLRAFALEALRMVSPEAKEGETATDGLIKRRMSVAPFTEHVSILQSRRGRTEALSWIDQSFGRDSDVTIRPTGHAIILLLAGLVLLTVSLAKRLPNHRVPPAHLSRSQSLMVLLLPVVAVAPVALALDQGMLPVLVADYLALHLATYGALQLGLLRFWRIPIGPLSFPAFAFLLAAAGIFGFALDRYAANFWPTGGRLWIIAAVAIGAVLFFLADMRLTHRTSLWYRLLVRSAFLLSLVFAVTLDFEGLFFLLMIAPVVVLFFIAFGTMGQAVSRRSGPLAPGIALGLILAWSLGVSFPLFAG